MITIFLTNDHWLMISLLMRALYVATKHQAQAIMFSQAHIDYGRSERSWLKFIPPRLQSNVPIRAHDTHHLSTNGSIWHSFPMMNCLDGPSERSSVRFTSFCHLFSASSSHWLAETLISMPLVGDVEPQRHQTAKKDDQDANKSTQTDISPGGNMTSQDSLWAVCL